MGSNFDLDLSFDEEPSEPDFSGVSHEDLAAAIDGLPTALSQVARGIILENRTMSDVSQAYAIRQSELVTRLHRAKGLLAESLIHSRKQ